LAAGCSRQLSELSHLGKRKLDSHGSWHHHRRAHYFEVYPLPLLDVPDRVFSLVYVDGFDSAPIWEARVHVATAPLGVPVLRSPNVGFVPLSGTTVRDIADNVSSLRAN
jgi:hypothetical protein